MVFLLTLTWLILSISGGHAFSKLLESKTVYVPAGHCFQLPCECLSSSYSEVEWQKKYYCDQREKEKIIKPNRGTSLRVSRASKDICTIGVFTCTFLDLQSNKTRSCQSFDVRIYECVNSAGKGDPIVFPPANITDGRIGDEKTFMCSVKFPCDKCLEQKYSFPCASFNCILPIYSLSWYYIKDAQSSKAQQHHISEDPRYNVTYKMINGGANISSKLIIGPVETVDFTRVLLCVVTMNNTDTFWKRNYRAIIKQSETTITVVSWKMYFSVLILPILPSLALLWKYRFTIRSKCFCRMSWLRKAKEFDVLVLSYDESRISRRIIEDLKKKGYTVACSDIIPGNRDELSSWSDLCGRSSSIVIVNSSEYSQNKDIQNVYELIIKSVKKIIAPEFITLVFEGTINKQHTFGVYSIPLSYERDPNDKRLYRRMPKPSKRHRDCAATECEPIFAIQSSYSN